jgi:hypothetical protein
MVQIINYYHQNLSNGLYKHITIKYVLIRTMFWKIISIIKIKKNKIQGHKIYLYIFNKKTGKKIQ